MGNIRQNNIRFFIMPFNVLIGAAIGIYGFLFKNSSIEVYSGCATITCMSIILLALQFRQFKYLRIQLMSSVGIFIAACHFFSFGEFYVTFFGHEDLLVYTNWFDNNFSIKYQSAVFSLAAIQSVFVGMFYWFSKHPVQKEKPVEFDYSQAQWMKIGLIFLIIGLPCRLVWDYKNILMGRISSIYAGGASVSGLLDDLQILFIPGLFCILHSLRKNKIAVYTITAIVILIEVFIMSQSGNRRLYITSIVGLALFIYYEYPWKKHAWWKFLLAGSLGIVALNFIELIRKYRFIGLGSSFFSAITLQDLFSLNVVWDCLAEFGLTSHAIYLDLVYFPKHADFYYGMTFLTSIIYIIPIGFIYNINRQASGIIEKLSGSPVGGSIVNDLFVNWGWGSLFLAPFLGSFLARISYKPIERGEISMNNMFTLMIFPLILGYARGDFFEVSRPAAYIFILFYICKKMFKPASNK